MMCTVVGRNMETYHCYADTCASKSAHYIDDLGPQRIDNAHESDKSQSRSRLVRHGLLVFSGGRVAICVLCVVEDLSSKKDAAFALGRELVLGVLVQAFRLCTKGSCDAGCRDVVRAPVNEDVWGTFDGEQPRHIVRDASSLSQDGGERFLTDDRLQRTQHHCGGGPWGGPRPECSGTL